MKKLFYLFLAATMFVGVVSCSESAPAEEVVEEVEVVEEAAAVVDSAAAVVEEAAAPAAQ